MRFKQQKKLMVLVHLLFSYLIITSPTHTASTISCLPNSRFTIVSPRIIRIEYINNVVNDTFEDRSSTAFAHRISLPTSDVEIDNSTIEWCNVSVKVPPYLSLSFRKEVRKKKTFPQDDNSIVSGKQYFQAHELSISNDKNDKIPFAWNIKMQQSKNLLGTIGLRDKNNSIGANVSGVDLAGCCTNPSYPKIFDPRYPLELGLISRDGWSLIDDSFTELIDNGTGDFDNGWVSEKGRAFGSNDLFFFGCGHEYATCLEEFVQTSGRISAPTSNALGIWWSRHWGNPFDHNPFGPMTEEAIMTEVVEAYEERNLPLNIVVLDMEWHSQVKYPQCDTFIGIKGWGGYTWNRTLFSNPSAFIDKLHTKNIHIATNFHPDGTIDACQDPYVDFAKALGVDPSTKVGLPDLDISQKNKTYCNAYFTYCIEPVNVDIAWTDTAMSTQWSNYLYVRFPALRKNKRTINFSRYAGIGDQRKPIGFSGDTYRLFDTLQYEVYMTPRAANIGFGWWSHDIGGFRVPKDETDAERYDNSNHTESPELFLRWLQFATFAPIFRTHCRYCEQRIWTWGDEWYPMMKETMMERHRLFPYINTHAHLETYAKGRSLLVPIYWSSTNAASMDEAYDPLFTNTEYLFGKHFLVAPITHSLKTTNTKKIWLPPGEWIDWYNSTNMYTGPITLTMDNLKLSDNFVFVNSSSIIPTQRDVVHNKNSKSNIIEHNKKRSLSGGTTKKTVNDLVENKLYPLSDPVVWVMFPSHLNVARHLTGELFEDDGISMDYRRKKNSGVYTNIYARVTPSTISCHVNGKIGNGLSKDVKKTVPSHRRHWFKIIGRVIDKVQHVKCGKTTSLKEIRSLNGTNNNKSTTGYWIDPNEKALYVNCGLQLVEDVDGFDVEVEFVL